MATEFLPLEEMLRLYLGRHIGLTPVRDWLARFQWDLDEAERSSVDDVDEAIVYYDDGHIGEDGLRLWFSGLLEKQTLVTVSSAWHGVPWLAARAPSSSVTSIVAGDVLTSLAA